MMNIIITNRSAKERYTIWIHLLLGILIFYFFIHPLTMIIYWFEMRETKFTFSELLNIAPERFIDSFSFSMVGMSVAFILLGSLVGLGSGIYYQNILSKNNKLALQDKALKRNIIAIIQNGESEKVEFKSSLRYDYIQNIINKKLEEVIMKTIAGFMNSNGGNLLIGIDDKGEILGLTNDYISLKKKDKDGFELKIYQLITNYIGIEFCSLVHLTFYNIDNEDICSLSVDASESPAYVNNNQEISFFVRVGNSTRPLTIKEAVKYIDSKWKR